ncbi:MAG TPA: glycoside hydrolase family 125 protein [Chthoniobacteraceae bacterium]|jgi:hypothetical protein|nr:glycoside hydrolase family 125 protein [Chthoniobacteraceae bacterium]
MSSLYLNLRPAADNRCFVSTAIDQVTQEVAARIRDPEIAWLFGNCFPNTLDTTVHFSHDSEGLPDTFVITGDIDAMWLRDSTNQVWPYLPFLRRDEALREMVEGLMRRQWKCLQIDPYANAFLEDGNRTSEWITDLTEMRPGVHERKYELDSLCAVLRLCVGYYDHVGDSACFDGNWLRAVELILDTIEAQQEGTSDDPPYRFARQSNRPHETLILGGRGQPARRCGLSKSPFRPSDDAANLPFLIPANAMAVVMLRRAIPLLRMVQGGNPMATRAEQLANAIDQGLRSQAVVPHPVCGEIFAYEIDGFGAQYLMDDANIPSLLSLPYFGYMNADDSLYKRTRSFVLSEHNPYYFQGISGSGIGGPHVGLGWIWPMAIIMQALTSTSEAEVASCLAQLKGSHGGTGFMHEAFWKDNASQFTRPWFAWANTLFGELILHIDRVWPMLLS